MEINKLTQRLLAEGYTKENPPDWVKRPWNEFYGGWEYPVNMVYGMVFETPCGLLVKGNRFTTGHMSFMGVDWTVENDIPTVTCPKIFDGTPCELNHDLLREHSTQSRQDRLTFCACRLTGKPYNYKHSFDKAHNDVWAESEEIFKRFDEQRKGRACKHHSHYCRATKTWHMYYNPISCAKLNNQPSACFVCRFCKILQKEVSSEKGNVYYDIKTIRAIKESGLFSSDQAEKITVVKGYKLLKHQTSITLCEAIVKYAKHRIQEFYNRISMRERIDDPSIRREVINIRYEKRLSRDLLQDLQDIREGIEVVHNSDTKKAAAQQKRDRKNKRQEEKRHKLEKEIVKYGFKGLDNLNQIRINKLLHKGLLSEERLQELESMRTIKAESTQLNLF